ncbi:MAG TPA: transcriptional repressor [Candidatus Dormibacteraeota bacterium]|nr:transcriptional repressor [Candidatus Dormibacteraeota bacterium]
MISTSEARLPRNHRLVLDVVRTNEQHLTVADIYARARAINPKIGYTTVYRALQRLSDQGLIRAFPSVDGKSTIYDRETGEHGHFACERCGALIDVAVEVPEELWRPFAAEHGVEVHAPTLQLTGLCAECRAASH